MAERRVLRRRDAIATRSSLKCFKFWDLAVFLRELGKVCGDRLAASGIMNKI